MNHRTDIDQVLKSQSKSLETRSLSRGALDLTLEIYSYDVVGIGIPRHPHTPGSTLLLFQKESKTKGNFLMVLLRHN